MFRDHSDRHFRGEEKILGYTSPQESSISARDGTQVSALIMAAEGTLRNEEIPGVSRKYSEADWWSLLWGLRVNEMPFICHLWSKSEHDSGVLNTLHEPSLIRGI